MFGIIYKRTYFSRKIVENVSLNVIHFACMTNQDSKSKSKTTPELISMPRIQLWTQNLEKSFR